jgi:hypothetical protein
VWHEQRQVEQTTIASTMAAPTPVESTPRSSASAATKADRCADAQLHAGELHRADDTQSCSALGAVDDEFDKTPRPVARACAPTVALRSADTEARHTALDDSESDASTIGETRPPHRESGGRINKEEIDALGSEPTNDSVEHIATAAVGTDAQELHAADADESVQADVVTSSDASDLHSELSSPRCGGLLSGPTGSGSALHLNREAIAVHSGSISGSDCSPHDQAEVCSILIIMWCARPHIGRPCQLEGMHAEFSLAQRGWWRAHGI